MKKILLTVVAIIALAISFSPAAQANAFLSITNGVTTVSCTTGGACAPGFTATGTTKITFSGSVGNFSISSLTLDSNAPGTAALGTSNDTKLQIQNTSGSTDTLIIKFAENNFTLPVTPDILSGSQSASLATGTTSQTFTASADAGNSLTPGAGTSTNTTTCGPITGVSQSCNANNSAVNFTHGANYALSGVETISLSGGGISNYTGTVNVTPNAVPEPSSLILLGTGMVLLASRKRFLRK